MISYSLAQCYIFFPFFLSFRFFALVDFARGSCFPPAPSPSPVPTQLPPPSLAVHTSAPLFPLWDVVRMMSSSLLLMCCSSHSPPLYTRGSMGWLMCVMGLRSCIQGEKLASSSKVNGRKKRLVLPCKSGSTRALLVTNPNPMAVLKHFIKYSTGKYIT